MDNLLSIHMLNVFHNTPERSKSILIHEEDLWKEISFVRIVGTHGRRTKMRTGCSMVVECPGVRYALNRDTIQTIISTIPVNTVDISGVSMAMVAWCLDVSQDVRSATVDSFKEKNHAYETI